MNWIAFAWAHLRAAPLTTAVNALLLGLGTASIVLLLLIGAQLAGTLSRDARGIDLVIGAKGSPVQLVLSSVYHADVPTGNIAQAEAARWAGDARVARAVPLSLGDSYRGQRIVGTTPDYLAIYGAELAQGRLWDAPMQAVAGASAAREAGLKLGAKFAGAHGLVGGAHEHAEQPYEIVGVLAATGTVLDRLILTSLDSVWALHDEGHEHDDHDKHDAHEQTSGPDAHEEQPDDDHHEHEAESHEHEHEHEHEHADAPTEAHEITAMLLSYATPLAATTLPREINQQSNLQAAAPAFELTRLLQIVGIGLDGLRAFAGLLILTAGFSVFAALYGALKARRHDLAMLRCLGATRGELLLCLLLEGLMLAALGALIGFALGHTAMELIGRWLATTRGVSATGAIWLPAETLLLIGLLGVGLLAAAVPAWQAYRGDVARTLAAG